MLLRLPGGIRIELGRHNERATLQSPASVEALVAMHQTVAASLASVNQSRWSLISNYLLANSLLLAAWAAVFVYEPSGADAELHRQHALFGLATLGLVISALWTILATWINGYVDIGHATSEASEGRLPDGPEGGSCPHLVESPEGIRSSSNSCTGTSGARCPNWYKCSRTFLRAWHYQRHKPVLHELVGTSEVMWLVPVLFCVSYFGLLWINDAPTSVLRALDILLALGVLLSLRSVLGPREIDQRPPSRQAQRLTVFLVVAFLGVTGFLMFPWLLGILRSASVSISG